MRLQFKLSQPQWSVLTVADARRPDAERQEEAKRFFDFNVHDLDPGFGKVLRQCLTCVADLFLPALQLALLLVARLVRGHTHRASKIVTLAIGNSCRPLQSGMASLHGR